MIEKPDITALHLSLKTELKSGAISKDFFVYKTIQLAFTAYRGGSPVVEVLRLLAGIDSEFFCGPFQELCDIDAEFAAESARLAAFLVEAGHGISESTVQVQTSTGALN